MIATVIKIGCIYSGKIALCWVFSTLSDWVLCLEKQWEASEALCFISLLMETYLFLNQMIWLLPSNIPLQQKVIPYTQEPVKQRVFSERKLTKEALDQGQNAESVCSNSVLWLFQPHNEFPKKVVPCEGSVWLGCSLCFKSIYQRCFDEFLEHGTAW